MLISLGISIAGAENIANTGELAAFLMCAHVPRPNASLGILSGFRMCDYFPAAVFIF